jgi:hypothetical protein
MSKKIELGRKLLVSWPHRSLAFGIYCSAFLKTAISKAKVFRQALDTNDKQLDVVFESALVKIRPTP